MLCDFCASIDLDRLYKPSTDGYALVPEGGHHYPHHATYKDLIISAGKGCDLCAMIWMRDVQRRHHSPMDCSVLGWEKLRGLDALIDCGDGIQHVSIPELQSSGSCEYSIDRQTNPRVYCCAGFTDRWYDGWENYRYDGTGPQELRFYQQGSTNDTWGTGLHSRLAISVDQDASVVSDLIRARPVSLHPMSTQCLSVIREWMRWCPVHPHCNPPSTHTLPTRVIDVGPSDGSQDPFLFITNGEKGSWIGLSWCWGIILPQRTTIATEKIRRRKIQHLPPVFRDAVIIARALGVRFLWIDALCIIQDSPQDWAAESSRMGRIYEDAFLTLQADAMDSSVSLLTPRRPADVWLRVPFTMNSEACNGHLYLGSEATDIARSFVNSRAWALQELVLSPRTLAINASGYIWSCRSEFASERMPEPYEGWVYTAPQWRIKMDIWSQDENADPIFHYYLLACEYMSRSLSRETDRLIAWSAIARNFGKLTKWEYFAGIWKEDMHRGLLWSYEGYGQGFSNYVAPTWSWASQAFYDIGRDGPSIGTDGDSVATDHTPKVFGSVFRNIITERDIKFDCSIHEIEVSLKTNDPYGQLNFAHLLVQGPWKEANLLCTFRMPYYVVAEARYLYTDDYRAGYFGARSESDFVQDQSVKIICDFDTSLMQDWEKDEHGALIQATDVQKRQARDWSQLSFLQIAKWKCVLNPPGTIWALILQAEDNRNMLFKRVGVAQVSDELASGWGRRTVKII